MIDAFGSPVIRFSSADSAVVSARIKQQDGIVCGDENPVTGNGKSYEGWPGNVVLEGGVFRKISKDSLFPFV